MSPAHMSPVHVSPVYVSPAHIPVQVPSTHVPSTPATPCPPCWVTSMPSICRSAALFHGAWGLLFHFSHSQGVPEYAGLSTSWRMGGRATKGAPESRVATSWPRGTA